MATTYSNELETVLNTTPATFADGKVVGGRMRRYRATITLATHAIASVINLTRVPEGSVFAYGVINSSVSLGTATIKIGDETTDDVYRALSTMTTANAPVMFGHSTGLAEGPIAAQKLVTLTTAVATLPASGTLVVDLYFSQA